LREYTNPSTGQPAFDGNVAFVATSGKPSPGSGYVDLSPVPTSSPSAKWQAATAALRENVTVAPVESMSMAVCTPKFAIESWMVDYVNGSMDLVERQPQSVGNLDPRQLNISIQDCFNLFPEAAPLVPGYGMNGLSLAIFVAVSFAEEEDFEVFTAYPDGLHGNINVGIPYIIQAYLDNFPFGEIIPPQSKLISPALVLSAELNFIIATAALYALLFGILFHLSTRPVAEQFTIRSVLDITREAAPPHGTDASCGQDVVARIEQILVDRRDMNDSAMATRINKLIGSSCTTVREDSAHRFLLEVDSQQHTVAPNVLLKCYESVQDHMSRIAWVFTPALGAALVGFGGAIWRHPHVVSQLPLNTNTTLFSALFTWGLGVWRSVSLLAISNLIQQANSDVSTPDDKLRMFKA
jgi:hypothetical protein